MKNINGFKTEAAYVASIIKNELKATYPRVKFSVRSQVFSMGDSVDISYTKGKDTPTCADVEKIVKKYQAGHFDGMTDSYEYSNKTDGPTAKYVFVREDYPDAVIAHVNVTVPRGSYPEAYQTATREAFEAYLSGTLSTASLS